MASSRLDPSGIAAQIAVLRRRVRILWRLGIGAPFLGVLIGAHAIWSLSQFGVIQQGGFINAVYWLELIAGVGALFAAPIVAVAAVRRLETRIGLFLEAKRQSLETANARASSRTARDRADSFRGSRGISADPDEALDAVKAGRRAVRFRKRLGAGLFQNPVLKRELLTSLRSDIGFALQFLFLATLALVIRVAWPNMDIHRSTHDIDRMTLYLLGLFGRGQLLLIAIIAPAFSAAGMTAEKEKRTIDLLLTTPVSRSAILVGKYLTSLTFLILLIFSSLPIVATMYWLKGVGTEHILSMFVILPCFAMMAAMVGLTLSIHIDRSQASVAVAYAIMLPSVGILLLLSFNDWFFAPTGAMVIAAATVLLLIALFRMNIKRLSQPFDRVRVSAEQEEKRELDLTLRNDRLPDRLVVTSGSGSFLPDGINPMIFKENIGVLGRGTDFLRWIILVMFLICVAAAGTIGVSDHIYAWVILAFAIFLTPAFSCPAFTHEREYGTMDMLLSSILTPNQIIIGKWKVAFRVPAALVALPGIFLVVLFPLFGAGGGFFDRLGAVAGYIAVIGATIAFLTSLGLTASLFFRTTLGAMLASYSFVFVVFALPALAAKIVALYFQASDRALLMIQTSSPFAAIYTFSERYKIESIGGTLSVTPVDISFQTWPWYLTGCAVLTILCLSVVRWSFKRMSRLLA